MKRTLEQLNDGSVIIANSRVKAGDKPAPFVERDRTVEERLALLEPNNFEACVEDNHVFSMPVQDFVIGFPTQIRVSMQPLCDIRPHHLIMNVADSGFLLLQKFLIGDNYQIDECVDAVIYGFMDWCTSHALCVEDRLTAKRCWANRQEGKPPSERAMAQFMGRPISSPVIKTSMRADFTLLYNGRVPFGYVVGQPYSLSIMLIGRGKVYR